MQLRAIVSGLVHGVFYRAFVQSRAQELGLVGFVQNSAGGQVLVIAEGDENKLKELEEKLWQGSDAAKVDNVEVQYLESSGEFREFEIL